MANYVEIKDGVETYVLKKKGRTRLGWVKGVDGNYRFDPSFSLSAHKQSLRKRRPIHYYITLDINGVEIERKPIGKGSPNCEFVKNTDGNYYRRLPL